MAELSPLRRRMIEDMTVRNMSPATQRSGRAHELAAVDPPSSRDRTGGGARVRIGGRRLPKTP
jgi:hypothetical protein